MSLLVMSTNPPSTMDRLSPSWIRRSISRSKSPQEPKPRRPSTSSGFLSPRTNSSKTNSTSDTTSASSDKSIKKRASFRGMVNRLRSSSSASSLGGAAQETDINDIHDWFHGFQAYNRLVTTQASPQSTLDSPEFAKTTKALSKNCGGTFIHGLPEATFDLALLWCPADMLSERELDTSSPSWSWTSYTGPVNFPFDPTTSPDTYALPRSENELFRSEILHYHTGPLSAPYTIRRDKTPSLRIKYPPYFHAPRGTTPTEESSTLRFTASTISADNFSAEQLHYNDAEIPISHLLNASQQHCGVLMDFESRISAPSTTGPYEFILLSRTRRPHAAPHTRRPRNPVMHPPGTPIWAGDAFVWDEEVADFDEAVFEQGEWKMLNVMLVRWVGEWAERVAVGRMHEDEWIGREPVRREVVLK